MFNTSTKIHKLLFLCILLFSTFIRLIYLINIPYVVHGDEAIIGLEAIKALNISHVKQLFVAGWYGYPQLTFLLPALSMKIVGESLFGLRCSSVFLGMCSILLTYFFVSKLRNATEAVIATGLLACAHMHIHFSRTGFHYMQGLLFSQASLFLFLLAQQKQKLLLFLLAGITTGLGFYVYLSARVAVCVVATIYFLSLFISKRALISYKQLFVFFAGFVGTILPILFTNIVTGISYSRSNQVFLFNNLSHLISVYNTTNWMQILREQLFRVGSFMFGGSDQSEQYGVISAGVDTITMILAGIGMVIWFYKEKHGQHNIVHVTSFVWLILVLFLGGVLTIDAPFYPRLLPAVVPISLFAAYAIHTLSKKLPLIIIWMCLICICLINIKIYFIDYTQRRPRKNTLNYTLLAKTLKNERDRIIILISNPQEFFLTYYTIRFIAPGINGITLNNEEVPQPPSLLNEPICIVISAKDTSTIQQIRLIYPNWVWETIANPYKEEIFYTVKNPRVK